MVEDTPGHLQELLVVLIQVVEVEEVDGGGKLQLVVQVEKEL
jgi:hypothetical protein